jgi:hypothetical protein
MSAKAVRRADVPMMKKGRAPMPAREMQAASGAGQDTPQRATQYGRHTGTISHQQPMGMRHKGGKG